MPVFRNFWDQALGNGVFTYKVPESKSPVFNNDALAQSSDSSEADKPGGFEVIISESVALGTGMHANNPWLMELPDPVSKQCWENVAALSFSDAEKLGIQAGDIIKFSNDLLLPAFLQPGQAEGTISVSLGYGHTNAGPVCTNVGVNMYPFAKLANGNRSYSFTVDNVEKTLNKTKLALTQEHYSMEGRPIVRDTVLSKYREDPGSGNEFHKEFEAFHETLYPEIKYDGFHWGLSIDLNSCVGCNACVIACQAENNIPVVGKAGGEKQKNNALD